MDILFGDKGKRFFLNQQENYHKYDNRIYDNCFYEQMVPFVSLSLFDLSKRIILGQEVGALPIHNMFLGFLCRMDVELVQNHHPLVLQVVERPLLGLAIGRDFGSERRIAGLGKLHPHLAHGLAEGLVEGAACVCGSFRMIEYNCKLYGMAPLRAPPVGGRAASSERHTFR